MACFELTTRGKTGPNGPWQAPAALIVVGALMGQLLALKTKGSSKGLMVAIPYWDYEIGYGIWPQFHGSFEGVGSEGASQKRSQERANTRAP